MSKFKNIEGIDLMPEISKATRTVQRTARDIVPVDTGTLKGSIHTKMYPKEQAGTVYTTVEYASYVEFGTTRMRAQPYMIPALGMNQKQINKDMQKYIKSELRKRVK